MIMVVTGGVIVTAASTITGAMAAGNR